MESLHERDRPARLPRGRGSRRAQGIRRARRRGGAERRPIPRRGRRVHQQPGQGRPGAVDAAGAPRRPGPGRGAQLRRRERVHRPARLPGHPYHRRTPVPGTRRAAWRGRRVSRRNRGLLDRPDRRAAADGLAADRARCGAGRGVPERRHHGGGRDPDHRHGEQDRVQPAGRLHDRRHGQGRGHARPGPGHHAVRADHRRRPAGQRAGQRAARSHPGDVRPAGHRRLHVHQRHRAAAGQRRGRHGAGPGPVHRRADRASAPTWPGSCRRTRKGRTS